MIDDDKWVWAEEEEPSPQAPPLLDKKLTPIVEWADLEPHSETGDITPALPINDAPSLPPESGVSISLKSSAENGSRKSISPSVVKAIVLHLEGKLEEAILELQTGLRNGEPPVELYTAMGALEIELERFEDAAATYRELLAIDPANQTGKHHLELCTEKLKEVKKSPKPPPSLVKAIVLHMEKKLDEAIKELQRGIVSGEQSVDVYSALGHLQFELGKFDLAAKAYVEVLDREPLHNTCHYNLAVCLEKLGRHEEALGSFQKAFEINSKRPEMGIGVGVALLHLRRFPEAVTAFNNCLDLHPEDAAALFGKAFALQCSNRLEEAKAAYLETLKRDPAQEEVLANLLAMSAVRGEMPAVREYGAKLLSLKPESRTALEALLTADLADGKYEAARNMGERLTRIAPDSFEGWVNYGVACHALGLFDEAASALSRATGIRPESAEAYASLGSVLQEKGDLAGAKKAYESSSKIAPENQAMLWKLVLIAEKSGATGEALKSLEALDSKSPDAALAAFHLGAMRFDQGAYKGSAEAFNLSLKANPAWPEAQLNLGFAQWKSANLGEARKTLESVEAPPHSVEALHHLAIMAIEREDYEAALACYQRLAKAGDRSTERYYNSGLILQNLGRNDEAADQYREALLVNPKLTEASQRLAQISEIKPDAPPRKNVQKDLTPVPQLIKSR